MQHGHRVHRSEPRSWGQQQEPAEVTQQGCNASLGAAGIHFLQGMEDVNILCAWMESESHDADIVEDGFREEMIWNGVIHNIVNNALDMEKSKQNLLLQLAA